jgi:hypothetical protein
MKFTLISQGGVSFFVAIVLCLHSDAQDRDSGGVQRRIGVSRLASIAGRFPLALLHVVDPGGASVAKAAGAIRSNNTTWDVNTDLNGKGLIDLPAGHYTACIRAPGFAYSDLGIDLPQATVRTALLNLRSATSTIAVSTEAGFVPFASDAGSKIFASLVDVPQSISIVSHQPLAVGSSIIGLRIHAAK